MGSAQTLRIGAGAYGLRNGGARGTILDHGTITGHKTERIARIRWDDGTEDTILREYLTSEAEHERTQREERMQA